METNSNFKPRNKYLNDILHSKRSEVHEAKGGKQAKRARHATQFKREMRDLIS